MLELAAAAAVPPEDAAAMELLDVDAIMVAGLEASVVVPVIIAPPPASAVSRSIRRSRARRSYCIH